MNVFPGKRLFAHRNAVYDQAILEDDHIMTYCISMCIYKTLILRM